MTRPGALLRPFATVSVLAALLAAACAAAAPTTTPTTPTTETSSSPPAPLLPSTTLAAAPPTAAMTMPAMSPLGSDTSALPALFPNGEWLPIEAPLLSMQLIVKVIVNGRSALAILDTGAMGTTISEPVAQRLGLLDADTPRGMPVRAVDAHGDVIFGEKVTMGTLGLGARTFRNLNVTVLGSSPDLFLLGADVLANVDLYVAADEGLVGVFEAGTAPRRSSDLVVPVTSADRQLVVAGAADGPKGPARFDFLVDTGAWNSSVPTVIGINAGLPADLAYSAITVGVAGEQEARGRFIISPLRLGRNQVPVGRVLAVSSTIDGGEGFGLLGNDVLMRFHTIISFRNAELRFRRVAPRPSTRMTGPGGIRCNGPCVSVRLAPSTREPAVDDWPGVCLQVDVDAAYARQTVELAITAEDDDSITLFNGGAIRAYVSVDPSGAHHCFPLWPQLERLGLRKDSALTLRWVRTEGVRWPCDPMKTRCISFTGPLAKLMVR